MLLEGADVAKASLSVSIVATALFAAAAAELHLPATLLLVALLLWLLWPLCCPTVQPHPYPTPTKPAGCCVLAGSFNPPHEGHLAMIAHLSATHRRVCVAVGFNPRKAYAVAPDCRAALLREMMAADMWSRQ